MSLYINLSFVSLNSYTLKETKKPPHYWKEAQNCRTFFDAVAKEKDFNPANPAAWQSLDLEQMLSKQVI